MPFILILLFKILGIKYACKLVCILHYRLNYCLLIKSIMWAWHKKQKTKPFPFRIFMHSLTFLQKSGQIHFSVVFFMCYMVRKWGWVEGRLIVLWRFIISSNWEVCRAKQLLGRISKVSGVYFFHFAYIDPRRAKRNVRHGSGILQETVEFGRGKVRKEWR